ncbi:hypothetical protein FRACYDRAFT_235511 [Fragilariopsis cylindrus CCMP1102]|uniref:Uncharacterized protein n=1 Tax=Fragilariopsis cylindrus CCMP1102 TaxID=635003 RepID=A0A1E7FMU4_9STRA|nr:hypothetical protein FRACYDRAFT_235511 [Fragilariopsis cylindrus CCMP1102]|eukprot:OEU19457.1 hypothetical protein FRACYDRAFT_235511 [Fragilariopsis cylindrus CCMP1102]
MDAAEIYEKLDVLLVCDGNDAATAATAAATDAVDQEGTTKLSSSQVIAYEHERFLVAWVLLTRLSQEHLDEAWGKHGNSLSIFVTHLLSDIEKICRTDMLLYNCYIRLVAQVTARLSTLPSEQLRINLYKSWKYMSTNMHDDLLNSAVALNIDICNTFIAWMEQDAFSFSSEVSLSDLWDVQVKVSAKLINLQQDDGTKKSMESTEYASDELVTNILLWIDRNGQEESISLDQKFGWHGWLMKYIGENISNRKKHSTLLREPKEMHVIQNIMLAHVVSPDVRAHRAMAWQTIIQIIQGYGWSWSEKSASNVAPICTWCRLACGEWKIQLEEELNLSSGSNRISILDGCGRLMLSVVQYLVDFEERPDKAIPLDSEGLLHLRQSLEETLYTTSEYLITSNVDTGIEPTVVINLWSQLFSEIYLPNSEEGKNVVTCFRKLLMASNDVTMMRALAHFLTTTHPKESNEHGLVDSIIAYTERSWQTLAAPSWLSLCHQHEEIYWACGATEILVDNQPERIHKITNSMQQAIRILVESLQSVPSKRTEELLSYLRLVVESYVTIIDQCHNTDLTFKDILSRAIEILKKD